MYIATKKELDLLFLIEVVRDKRVAISLSIYLLRHLRIPGSGIGLVTDVTPNPDLLYDRRES